MDLTTTAARSFDPLNLSAETLASLDAMGYKAPTDVQFETIPRAQAGKDLAVQSRTGTGKTAAFAIPMVEKVDPTLAGVQAVALAPPPGAALPGPEGPTPVRRSRAAPRVSIYAG